MEYLLKPIDRITYIIGLIFISMISFAVSKVGGIDTNSIGAGEMLYKVMLLAVVFGIIKIVWDYKRIKDIGTISPFILLIPIIETFSALFLASNADNFKIFGGSASSIFSIMGVGFLLVVIKGIYRLFLIFKEGKKVEPPVAAVTPPQA